MKKKQIRFLAFIMAVTLCFQAPVTIRAETLGEAATGDVTVSEEAQADDSSENISIVDNVSDNVGNVGESLDNESNTSSELEEDISSDAKNTDAEDEVENETSSTETQDETEVEVPADTDEYGNLSGASNEDATYEGYVENEDGSWTVMYSDGTTVTVDKDTVRQSNWYKEKYENADDELELAELTYYHVTFTDSLTDEVVSEQDVLEGDSATEPEVPEHENYEFSGYSADFSSVIEDMDILIEYEASVVSFDYENDEIVESELADEYGEENPEWYEDFGYNKYNNGTLYLHYYKGNKKDVFIPSTATINGKKYSIDFSYSEEHGRFFTGYEDYVESVILSPDADHCLPTAMFAGLTIPTRVYLPNFKIYGDSVFKGCTNITDVTIGKKECCYNWDSPGYYTFESCISLQNVNISSDTYFYVTHNDFKNAGSEGLTLTLTGLFGLQRSDCAFVGANYDKLSFNGVLKIGEKTGDTFKGANIKIIDFANTTIIDDPENTSDRSVDGFFANSNIEEVYFGDNSRLINSFEEYTYKNENYGPYYTNLFKNCKTLRIVDWPNADSAGIISINSMFYNCTSLTTLNLGPNFTCSDVSRGLEDGNSESGTHQYDGGMTDVFKNCTSLKSLDLSNWDNKNSKACNSMFAGCTSLETITFGENFTCESCETIVNMFKGCSALKYIDMSSFELNSMLEGWNTTIIKGCDALIAIDTPTVTNEVVTKLDYGFYEISDDHAEYDTWVTLPSDMEDSHRIYRYMNTINIESYFKNEDGTIDTLDDMFMTRYFYRPIDLAYFNLNGEDLDANDWYVYADDNGYSVDASMIDLDDNTYAFADATIDSANPGTYKFVYSVKKAVVPDDKTDDDKADDKTEDDKTDDTNSDASKNDATSNGSNNNAASSSSATSNAPTTASATNSDVTITYAEPEGAEESDNATTSHTTTNPGTGDISAQFIIVLVVLFGAGICLSVYGARSIKKENK